MSQQPLDLSAFERALAALQRALLRSRPASELRLSPAQRAIVQAILARYLPDHEVRAFGSRAHGRGLKPWSDLDLMVIGDAPIDPSVLSALAIAFDDSDLPFRLDLLTWPDAPPALREAIRSASVVVSVVADVPSSTKVRVEATAQRRRC